MIFEGSKRLWGGGSRRLLWGLHDFWGVKTTFDGSRRLFWGFKNSWGNIKTISKKSQSTYEGSSWVFEGSQNRGMFEQFWSLIKFKMFGANFKIYSINFTKTGWFHNKDKRLSQQKNRRISVLLVLRLKNSGAFLQKQKSYFLNHFNCGQKIQTEINKGPVNTFFFVFFLFENEHVVIEELLQSFISEIDTQLFETIVLNARRRQIEKL